MNKNPHRSVVIAGCGYVGLRLARSHIARGDRVVGIRRSQEAEPTLRAGGVTPLITDLAAPDLSGIETIDRVYYLAPPPPQGETDDVIGGFLQALKAWPPGNLVYVGTTGVYGDRAGAWVDEATPLRPESGRARRRVDAERRVRAFLGDTAWLGSRLRVGGIYGPGRLPLARLQQGEPVLCPEESAYSNRIHVDDLVAACLAAGKGDWKDEVFNVVDGHPSTMTDYFYAVADASGTPRPPCLSWSEAEARFSAAMMSYLRESRRIDNRRLRERLGVTLRYSDLREGLRASLREERSSRERG